MRSTILVLTLLAAPAFAEAPAPKPATKSAPTPADKAAPAPAAKTAPVPATAKKPVKIGQFCPKEAEGTTQDAGDALVKCEADKKGKFRWQKTLTPPPPT